MQSKDAVEATREKWLARASVTKPPATLNQLLQIYLGRISKRIAVEQAYLVGSWAKGTATVESDVDVLIVSTTFDGMDTDRRLELLYRQSVDLGLELHLLPVTPHEFNTASPLTALGAMRQAEKILLLSI